MTLLKMTDKEHHINHGLASLSSFPKNGRAAVGMLIEPTSGELIDVIEGQDELCRAWGTCGYR